MPDTIPTGSTKDMMITLREYVDLRFRVSDEAIQVALAAVEKANHKAEQANDKRFESINEFRSALNDAQLLNISRTEYSQAHQNLIDRIDSIAGRIGTIEQAGVGKNAAWALIAGGVGILTGIVSILFSFWHVTGPMK